MLPHEAKANAQKGTEMIRVSLAMPRDFNVPHAMVWTDPKQVALWGPKGFTATIERGGPAPQFEMMATFAEEGKTRLAMRMIFAASCDRAADAAACPSRSSIRWLART